MQKSNITGTVFVAHKAFITMMSVFTTQQDANSRPFKAMSSLIAQTYIPENIGQVIAELEKTADDIGLAGAQWFKEHIADLHRQDSLGAHGAKQEFVPFHDALMSSVLATPSNHHNVLKTLLELADMTKIPADKLQAVIDVIEYKAETIDATGHTWLQDALTNLKARVSDDSSGTTTQSLQNGSDTEEPVAQVA